MVEEATRAGHLDFVAECRHMRVMPHVAQNHTRWGGSAIDERTRMQATRSVNGNGSGPRSNRLKPAAVCPLDEK